MSDMARARGDALFSAGGVGDLIVTALERHAGRTAFVCRGREVSFRRLHEEIGAALRQFTALGLKPGDAIMQIASNRYEVFVVTAAAFIGGYVSVVPSASGSLDDHRYMLDDCGAALLVADARYAEHVWQVASAARKPPLLSSHDEGTALPHFWEGATTGESLPVARERPDDMIRLIYTGGTTGTPKGVTTLSRALAFASLLHMAEQGFSTATRMLVSSPISHGAGAMVIPVLSRGGCVVIHDGFDPGRVLDAIAERQATHLFVVPTMLYALMDYPLTEGANLSGLQRIIYTAAPISPTRLERALRLFGPILHQNYGQTEVPGTILALTPEDHLDPRGSRLTSAGKPYPCVSVRILDDTGEEVPSGSIGELCVRAPHVTEGYWNKPEATRELLRDGWLHTGDMANRDANGYFHIVDRKKDMIISGGFNIYPQELENVLAEHPAVSAAAIIGIPDEKWGEAVKAIVVTKDGHGVRAEELIAFVKSRKGPVMTPKSLEFVASLPLTAVGKVDKKALRAPYWTDRRRVN